MATLHRRMSRWCDGDDGPLDAAISHGSAGTDPGTDEMGEARLVPIHLADDPVQPREGKHHCRCSLKGPPWSDGGTRVDRNSDDTDGVFSSSRSRVVAVEISIGGRPQS